MNKLFLETIKVQNFQPYNLFYHEKRMNNSVIGVSDTFELKSIIKPPTKDLYRCRIVYSKNSLEISYHSYKKRDIKKLKLVESDIVYDKKYANRDELDNLYQQKDFYDDILIVKNGYITDTSIANIAFFDGKKWLTPIYPLLYGTTRERLLSTKFLEESHISVDDISKFTKVALMNAMIDFDIIAEENIKEIIC